MDIPNYYLEFTFSLLVLIIFFPDIDNPIATRHSCQARSREEIGAARHECVMNEIKLS